MCEGSRFIPLIMNVMMVGFCLFLPVAKYVGSLQVLAIVWWVAFHKDVRYSSKKGLVISLGWFGSLASFLQ